MPLGETLRSEGRRPGREKPREDAAGLPLASLAMAVRGPFDCHICPVGAAGQSPRKGSLLAEVFPEEGINSCLLFLPGTFSGKNKKGPHGSLQTSATGPQVPLFY